MFAPLTAKAQTKTLPLTTENSLRCARPFESHRGDWSVKDEQTRRRLPEGEPPTPDQAPLGVGWDFSTIPLYPSERADGSDVRASIPAPRLPSTVQAKLKVGAVDDPLEHEADRVAEQVMRMPAPELPPTTTPPQMSRKCEACEDKEEKLLKKPAGVAEASLSEAPASVHEVLSSPGQPLDTATRAFFEPRFGRDFGYVRLHADGEAAGSADAVGALAYTAGQHIVFGAGAYGPTSCVGRRLLAHELTHAIQQSSHYSVAASRTAIVQRSPEPSPQSKVPLPSPLSAPKQQTDRWLTFVTPIVTPDLKYLRVVNESTIIDWAANHIFNSLIIGDPSLKPIFVKQLQRGEDNQLHEFWDSYHQHTIGLVAPLGLSNCPPPRTQVPVVVAYPRDNPFSGSEAARCFWAEYLKAQWAQVEGSLDEKVRGLLIQQIEDTLHSGYVLSRATLQTDPKTIVKIDDHPDTRVIDIGRPDTIAHQQITVGWEWQHKRIKSISGQTLEFEVIGHEGIYFEITIDNFKDTDPYFTSVFENIAESTKFASELFPLLIKVGAFGLGMSVSLGALIASAALNELGEEGLRQARREEHRSPWEILKSATLDVFVGYVMNRVFAGGHGVGEPAPRPSPRVGAAGGKSAATSGIVAAFEDRTAQTIRRDVAATEISTGSFRVAGWACSSGAEPRTPKRGICHRGRHRQRGASPYLSPENRRNLVPLYR